MQDPFPIPPFTSPLSARVAIPGSKSITNRALVMAALSDGPTRLRNCLFSRDTDIMVEALRQLGFSIETHAAANEIHVEGLGGRIPAEQARIHVGNSGTSARFLTAMIATRHGGEFELVGDEAMARRPIQRLADTLMQLGCHIDTSNGFFPIRIRPSGLADGEAIIDASESSQFVSALLMAAPRARGPLAIRLSSPQVRRGYIDLTLGMMQRFGYPRACLSVSEDAYRLQPQSAYRSPGGSYLVESDASAASYFFALPLAVGGEIEIQGVSESSMQADIQFARMAAKAGASIEWQSDSAICRFDPRARRLQPLRQDFYAFSDTFMTAAALAPLMDGPSRIEGIAHTRHQECDRIDATARGLRGCGQTAREEPGALEILPAPLRAATIETFEDHRIAMSFAILGCHDAMRNGQPWLQIVDPLCCRKTFPSFFDTLEQARQDSLQALA